MIIKGRSPTMRHVSRTHRIALDWLLDRINLEPKIQIKYYDTKNQLADMLTIGSFTRDEWNHLLCLFNINEFPDVLLQPFQQFSFWPDQEAECHVKERTRSDFQWRFTDGKTKASDFGGGEVEAHESGVAQPVECEEEPNASFELSSQSGEC